MPYEVPSEVVSVNRTDLVDIEDGTLSDHILFIQDESTNQSLEISVKTGQSGNSTLWEKVFSLEGFVMREQFAMTQASVNVKKSPIGGYHWGIMGLADQVSDNLFLEDGVYTLWNRNQNSPESDGRPPGKNMYASNPFYMGRANDSNWLGVYHNSAAATDWWIENDADQG